MGLIVTPLSKGKDMLSCLYYKKSVDAPTKGYVGNIVDDNADSCLMVLDNGEYRRFLKNKVICRVDRRPVFATICVGYANVRVK